MIVLLNYSINLSANNINVDSLHHSTGEVIQSRDSVLISYNDLRIANSKLIELEYEKQINTNLRNIIFNDSIIIKDYQVLNKRINENHKKITRQRNIAFGVVTFLFLTTIITLFIK